MLTFLAFIGRQANCYVHECGPGPEHTCMPGFADTLVADILEHASESTSPVTEHEHKE